MTRTEHSVEINSIIIITFIIYRVTTTDEHDLLLYTLCVSNRGLEGKSYENILSLSLLTSVQCESRDVL